MKLCLGDECMSCGARVVLFEPCNWTAGSSPGRAAGRDKSSELAHIQNLAGSE